MAINLSKGQSIQLDKKKNNLSNLVMSWVGTVLYYILRKLLLWPTNYAEG